MERERPPGERLDARQQHPRATLYCRPHAWQLLALVLGIAVTMMACGTPTTATTARATQTAQAQQTSTEATRAAEPVWADITASEQGTVAGHDVRLTIAVTITNRTSATIAVVYNVCDPEMQIQVRNPTGDVVWAAGPDHDYNGCENAANRDLIPSLATGQSHTWTYAADLRTYPGDVNPVLVVPRGRYRITVQAYWHQGPLQVDPTTPYPPSVLTGMAQGETAVLVS